MTRRTITLSITLLVMACFMAGAVQAALNTLTPAEKPAGGQLLFDGETLNGWKATGNAEGWAVKDGTITNLAKGGGMLATIDRFGNFALSMEFKVTPHANSGVFFRWAVLGDPVQRGIEIQILDSYGVEKPGKHDCGAIYDCLAPRKNACQPAGEWNKMVLTCRNSLIWIDMNGKRIVYMNLDRWTTPHMNPDGSRNKFRIAYKDMAREGHIGLQDHGHKVWFRNIKIKPL